MTQSRWSGQPPAGANVAASRAGAPAPARPTSDAPTSAIPTVPAASGATASRPTDGRPPRPAKQTRGPRRARLQLRHINALTVLKFSCVLAVALFFVWLIVIGVLYGLLDGVGVLQKINDTVTTINGPGSKPPITAGIVFGGAAVIGAVNIVLFIALSTIGAVIYNLCADLVGGIEITLSER
jgi:hypothetical protein